jgi:hypothetical protein
VILLLLYDLAGTMDMDRNANDSRWAEQASIGKSFCARWIGAPANVRARRINIPLGECPRSVRAGHLHRLRLMRRCYSRSGGGLVRGCDVYPLSLWMHLALRQGVKGRRLDMCQFSDREILLPFVFLARAHFVTMHHFQVT